MGTKRFELSPGFPRLPPQSSVYTNSTTYPFTITKENIIFQSYNSSKAKKYDPVFLRGHKSNTKHKLKVYFPASAESVVSLFVLLPAGLPDLPDLPAALNATA